jgi:2'-5' RNA ligase
MNDFSRTFDEAWQRFLDATSLRMVEDTLESEWRRGRSEFLAFLIPIEDAAARDHIASIISAIEGVPGVQPYQESYWHITVKGLGFRVENPSRPDEISPAVVEAVSAGARRTLADAEDFHVSLGPVNSLAGVVCLEVEASGSVQELNRRILDSAPEVPRSPADDLFLPHISIAHFTSNDGLTRLKSTLQTLRNDRHRGPTFTATRVDLILARLSASGPTFELISSYPLLPADS